MSADVPYLQLLQGLAKRDIRFVLVGGLAVGAWGYIRATQDIDLVPDPEPENRSRLIDALEEIGGRVLAGDDLLDPGSVRVVIRAGDKALIQTELGIVDVLQGLPQIPRYAELDAEAEDAELEGVSIRVCSLRHLVAMKRSADRPMDRIDLDALRTAHPEAFEEDEDTE